MGVDKLDEFTRAYVECALWSSTDANDTPMFENYSTQDIAPETLARMIADCAEFQRVNEEWISDEQLTHGPVASREHEGMYRAVERAGHDFCLTRNGHGAGFWDGDWEEAAGAAMDAYSKRVGAYELYVGDDGRIYGQ